MRETYGAALAALQAERAADSGVRRLMRLIARDELQHAALAWHIAAWLEARLDVPARDRVRGAREQALATLEAEILADADGDISLGLPDGETLRGVLRRMTPAIQSGNLAHAAA